MLSFFVSASAHPGNTEFISKVRGRDALVTSQVFYGPFLSTPEPGKLLIQSGAVLVPSNDRKGVISKTAWNVEDAISDQSGLFFPEFMGKRSQLFLFDFIISVQRGTILANLFLLWGHQGA